MIACRVGSDMKTLQVKTLDRVRWAQNFDYLVVPMNVGFWFPFYQIEWLQLSVEPTSCIYEPQNLSFGPENERDHTIFYKPKDKLKK